MEYTPEQELLRQTLLDEAGSIVSGLTDGPDILAAFLTGSAAWGKPNPDGDLDILLITRKNEGVFYRYLVPTFCHVPRRTELGFIPLAVLNDKIDMAYGDPISCQMIEQFKHGRILFQQEGWGDRIVEACRTVNPSKMLIGKSINDLCGYYGALDDVIATKDYRKAYLASRKILGIATRLLLLVRNHLGVAKEKQELKAVQRHFDPEETGTYMRISGVNGYDQVSAFEAIAKTIALMTGILSDRAISDKIVSYNGLHAPSTGRPVAHG